MNDDTFSTDFARLCATASDRHYPLIAVSSAPRVGSMWTYNVTRALSTAMGYSVLPDFVPWQDDDKLAAARCYVDGDPENTRCLIKTHHQLARSPKLKVIFCERDIRDCIFSHGRFLQETLEEAFVTNIVTEYFGIKAHYDALPEQQRLTVQFADIDSNSQEVIRRIGTFIGVETAAPEVIDEIDQAFSKAGLEKKMAELERALVLYRTGFRFPEWIQIVSGRAYDLRTGFQSGHVSAFEPGDWETQWSTDEQRLVDNVIQDASARRA